MKLRFGFHIFLPIMVLALIATIACGQDQDETPASQGLLPTVSPIEPARPLTAEERSAIDEFVSLQQSIDEERERFYQDFDQWRADIIDCHPTSAQETLRGFAASFGAITESARNLPRTSSTKELADLLITAADSEEAAFRQLRDRWQPGNISLLEAVELRRVDAGRAQNSVVDMSLQLQEEFEEGPTADEVEEMEEFSDTFDEIADSWDDFHDDHASFVKRERRLQDDAIVSGYEQLIEQFREIVSVIGELTPTEVSEELIETLQVAAEAELEALEYLLGTLSGPSEPSSEPSGPVTAGAALPSSATATRVSLPAQSPAPPEEPPLPPAQEAPAAPSQSAPDTPESAETPAAASEDEGEMGPSPKEEPAAAIKASEAALEEVEQAIEEIVNDKSAEYLQDLKGFDVEYQAFVNQWNSFYAGFANWRATDGGCQRVDIVRELTRYSQQAGELAGKVRGLTQSGFLLPMYTLSVEAAEREEGAFRTLASSWTPFSVDVFKAVDEERVSASRLRLRAGIALEELRSRP